MGIKKTTEILTFGQVVLRDSFSPHQKVYNACDHGKKKQSDDPHGLLITAYFVGSAYFQNGCANENGCKRKAYQQQAVAYRLVHELIPNG